MPILTGRHEKKLDKKGRALVPKFFRDFLKTPEFNGFYVFPSFRYRAIEGCGESFMQRLNASLDEKDLFSDEQEDLNLAILENAQPLFFDPEGRIVLPEELRDEAGITDCVLFVGNGSRLRIWNPDIYLEYSTPALDRIRKNPPTLPLLPNPNQGTKR